MQPARVGIVLSLGSMILTVALNEGLSCMAARTLKRLASEIQRSMPRIQLPLCRKVSEGIPWVSCMYTLCIQCLQEDSGSNTEIGVLGFCRILFFTFTGHQRANSIQVGDGKIDVLGPPSRSRKAVQCMLPLPLAAHLCHNGFCPLRKYAQLLSLAEDEVQVEPRIKDANHIKM